MPGGGVLEVELGKGREVYGRTEGTYTGSVSFQFRKLRGVFLIWAVIAGVVVCAQEPAKEPVKAPEKPASATSEDDKSAKPKSEDKAALPFQIELLQTRVRFEANGDSRKEVHTVVKINDAGGARQFAWLGFDYNRSFQSVEIPLVKISHTNGGTSEILPSAIGDVPNPAVEKFPAYQDVRVKTVRILGLQEGDTLEYRVITTTTKPPLAPDFWLEHTFDKSGQVVEEDYCIDLPAFVELKINQKTPANSVEKTGEGRTAREILAWHRKQLMEPSDAGEGPEKTSDIAISTFNDWMKLSARMAVALYPESAANPGVTQKFQALTAASSERELKLRKVYEFVAQTIRTVELPIGSTGYHARPPEEILASGYATEMDKAVLLVALSRAGNYEPFVYLTFADENTPFEATPSRFQHVLVGVEIGPHEVWMAPAIEVAPFGMIPSSMRGKTVLCAKLPAVPGQMMVSLLPKVPTELPFHSVQKVEIAGAIFSDGKLAARVKYVMRGDNELLLREAFHQAPKERWNEVAGLLALSDGFRGHIESVKASDPMETEKPFEVEYEITQPKFVDWEKKPVRIPALLPQIALPDAPGKAGGKIELGTPLDVETEMTLKLPQGTTVQTPPGTSVERDYATYASKYEGHLNTVTASRHVHFVMRELPGERSADYNAFARAIKNDEGQAIGLFAPEKTEKK